MIGLRLLAAINARMGEVWPGFRDLPFGGRSVMLIGDFFQLPPVLERALYINISGPGDVEVSGREAYRAFGHIVELKQVVRQQGDDQAAFSEALNGLRQNNPTIEQWRLLSSRVQSTLPAEEVASFDGALRIYPLNSRVNEYNLTHLEGLAKPCYQVVAENTGPRAGELDAADAGNLQKNVPLVLGARVMLTENVWTDAGLGPSVLSTTLPGRLALTRRRIFPLSYLSSLIDIPALAASTACLAWCPSSTPSGSSFAATPAVRALSSL